LEISREKLAAIAAAAFAAGARRFRIVCENTPRGYWRIQDARLRHRLFIESDRSIDAKTLFKPLSGRLARS